MSQKNYKPDILQTIIVGIFKALWWLVTLPFRGIKFGRGKTRISLEEKNYITSKRFEIEKVLDSGSEIELKHLVLEADKLVDYALKSAGYRGETFADRLRSAESSMPKAVYNEVWQGHKVRNQIAHEQKLRISNQELREAAKKLINYLKYV